MPDAGLQGHSTAPYFEDLEVGLLERSAPGATLTSGMAAVHQAIVGDRLALALDATLAERVLGAPRRTMAHPALVWDVAIGQSTLLTRRVIANLFYRGLVLKRFPLIGDTLSTTTEVVALRTTQARPDRPASGLAALRVRTVDQEARPVLDFWRCAMLPLRGVPAAAGPEDSFESIPEQVADEQLAAPISSWRLEELARGAGGLDGLRPGMRWRTDAGDVVSAAPELARLTLNIAFVHHDSHAHTGGRRLVYGGHTIGLAASQAARLLPRIATILGWHSCRHVAPVAEGDTLVSELELERIDRVGEHAAIAHLRSRVQTASDADPDRPTAGSESADGPIAPAAPARPRTPVEVLDWRFAALLT